MTPLAQPVPKGDTWKQRVRSPDSMPRPPCLQPGAVFGGALGSSQPWGTSREPVLGGAVGGAPEEMLFPLPAGEGLGTERRSPHGHVDALRPGRG